MNRTTFEKQDGVDLKALFMAQIEVLRTLIDANDKNYNQRFDNVVEATKSALASSDRAVSKAEMASEKRFDAVNEFRATLADQQRNLMPRAEVEIITKSLIERIEKIEDKQTINEGKGFGVQQGWGWAVAILMFIIAIVGFIFGFIE